MPEQRIQQHFIDSADLTYQAAQLLAPAIAETVHILLECVTNGGKILACGCGLSAWQARQFAALGVSGFERHRPALAILALEENAAGAQVFARQIHALGQAGDVLLLLAAEGSHASLVQAIQAAHERDMQVIALHGLCDTPPLALNEDEEPAAGLQGLLGDGDISLRVPHHRPARVREVHSLILHGLCDGIDMQLLGEEGF